MCEVCVRVLYLHMYGVCVCEVCACDVCAYVRCVRV